MKPKLLNCGGCGACCSLCGHPPFRNAEIHAHADGLGMPLELWRKVWAEINAIKSDDGLSRCAAKLPCSQFDPRTKRCRIHKYRPARCREFNIGCDDCLRFREEHHVGGWRNQLSQRTRQIWEGLRWRSSK